MCSIAVPGRFAGLHDIVITFHVTTTFGAVVDERGSGSSAV